MKHIVRLLFGSGSGIILMNFGKEVEVEVPKHIIHIEPHVWQWRQYDKQVHVKELHSVHQDQQRVWEFDHHKEDNCDQNPTQYRHLFWKDHRLLLCLCTCGCHCAHGNTYRRGCKRIAIRVHDETGHETKRESHLVQRATIEEHDCEYGSWCLGDCKLFWLDCFVLWFNLNIFHKLWYGHVDCPIKLHLSI